MPADVLRMKLNDELPSDVHVLAAQPVGRRFHARHGALSRSYLYQISRRRTALAKPFVWWIKDALDVRRMAEAAALFRGMHDFQSFTDLDPEDGSTRVLLEGCEVAEEGAWSSSASWARTFSGRWCGGWWACWPEWDAAASASRTSPGS